MDPTELLNNLFFVFFGAWVLVETQATESMWSMFGSAVTTHLTNPSGGSSCKENSAKTPERPHTQPWQRPRTVNSSGPWLSLCHRWVASTQHSPAHCTACILSKRSYSVRNSSSSLPIISDKAVLIVHNLWLERVGMKGLHNECDYES